MFKVGQKVRVVEWVDMPPNIMEVWGSVMSTGK